VVERPNRKNFLKKIVGKALDVSQAAPDKWKAQEVERNKYENRAHFLFLKWRGQPPLAHC